MNKPLKAIAVIIFLCIFSTLLSTPSAVYSAGKEEKGKKPYPQFWMDVSTQNMSIPGMEGMSGALFGKMAGGKGFGPSRSLLLKLNSPQKLPADPFAANDIPPGQNMGKALPLLIPEKVKAEKHEYVEREEPRDKVEKPKVRMLIYWGCSEEVRQGQPRVLDTEKMSMEEFGKSMGSLSNRTPSHQYGPVERSGWVYADWPNKESHAEVPKNASLQGSQVVRGNYIPEIKFTIDEAHDFMAPVEFSSITGGLEDSIRFEWREVPAAVGYFAMAMAHNKETGETILWSSSEVPEAGFGLMGFLSPGDVQKFLKERVVLQARTTSCTIPKAIFNGTGGSMLQFIAYGDELNVVHPPKPKDPKQPWHPEWAVKVRLKSSAMTPLGQAGEERRSGRVKERHKIKEQDEESDDSSEKSDKTPQRPEKRKEEGTSPMKKLKGIFGF